MFLVPHALGHVAVTQPAHGLTCAQLARAWGNERFGGTPAGDVILAAEQHDMALAEWELAPTLNAGTGLPDTFETVALRTLDLRAEGVRRLARQSRYAALLVSLHICSLLEAPGRDAGPTIQPFLDESSAFQAGLRATLNVTDAELERDLGLVRTWDRISVGLLAGPLPATCERVPEAAGWTALRLEHGDGAYGVAPWPFASGRVVLRTEGRLLEQTFTGDEELRDALVLASWIDLRYELIPG